MSEVKHYFWVQDGMSEGGKSLDTYVKSPDFDRVTAERDAALGRETALIDQLDAALRQVKANWDYAQDKQQRLTAALLGVDRLSGTIEKLYEEILDRNQRLTAADERADLLEGLLREVQKSARKQDWASGYPTLFASVDAALKPAEGWGDEQ